MRNLKAIELHDIMRRGLAKDPTTIAAQFCNGADFSDMVSTHAEERLYYFDFIAYLELHDS
jgi:hypothetical protein